MEIPWVYIVKRDQVNGLSLYDLRLRTALLLESHNLLGMHASETPSASCSASHLKDQLLKPGEACMLKFK